MEKKTKLNITRIAVTGAILGHLMAKAEEVILIEDQEDSRELLKQLEPTYIDVIANGKRFRKSGTEGYELLTERSYKVDRLIHNKSKDQIWKPKWKR